MQSTIATFSSQAFIHLKHEINFTVLINFIFFCYCSYGTKKRSQLRDEDHKPLLLQIF